MNEIEAIEQLKFDKELAKRDYISPTNHEEYDLAIMALEKQIPKKPTHHKETDDEYEHHKCTNCKIVLDSTTRYMKYDCCPDCGQKLDWSEVEYE